jgi:hypothetical protein
LLRERAELEEPARVARFQAVSLVRRGLAERRRSKKGRGEEERIVKAC